MDKQNVLEQIKMGDPKTLNHIACKALIYSDDGKGMDEDTKSKIYEPFFTTARNIGGSGLGMNIVFNCISQQLGGTVECESSPGEGARFMVTAPITLE